MAGIEISVSQDEARPALIEVTGKELRKARGGGWSFGSLAASISRSWSCFGLRTQIEILDRCVASTRDAERVRAEITSDR